MRINNLGDVIGAVAQENIVEGLCVYLTAMSSDYQIDFGSRADLVGVKVPASAAQAAKAFYIVTWAVDNTVPPIYEPYPQISWSLRYGAFDQTANVPFDAKVRMTQPSVQIGQTIPSGYLCLAHSEGRYTLISGEYVYSASAVMLGEYLTPEYSGNDAGKLKHSATATQYMVIGYESATGELVVRSIP